MRVGDRRVWTSSSGVIRFFDHGARIHAPIVAICRHVCASRSSAPSSSA
jgi:hypothetical protein